VIEFEVAPLTDGATVVSPRGRLDMVAASELRSIVAEVVGAGSTRLVVDLVETAFLDSSGLGALIAGLKTTRQAGGDLRIARPTEQVQMVLELTQMNTVLRPYPSVEAALAAG
jgi:anti-sigma B factor antagonist